MFEQRFDLGPKIAVAEPVGQMGKAGDRLQEGHDAWVAGTEGRYSLAGFHGRGLKPVVTGHLSRRMLQHYSRQRLKARGQMLARMEERPKKRTAWNLPCGVAQDLFGAPDFHQLEPTDPVAS